MKTVLLTLGLSAVFCAVGVFALRGGFASIGGGGDEVPSDSTAAAHPVEAADVAALRTQLSQLQTQLARAEARADSLHQLIEGRQSDDEEDGTQAAELATTLTKLDDDALSEVIQRLDGRTFVRLYEAASPRNRGRLLDALTPAQAAAFVRHQLPGGGPMPATVTRDSTAAAS